MWSVAIRSFVVLPGAGHSRYDPKCVQREGADVLPIPSMGASGAAQRICSYGGAGAGRHDVLGTAVGRAAGHPAVGRADGKGRRAKRSQVRLERIEAGSVDSFRNDAFLSCRIESPSSRVARVTSALHNLCPAHSSLIPAHNSHARLPHARCVVNSVGDTEVGDVFLVYLGGTKSLSTSTRSGVRCSAVYESAHTQQRPLKLHVETWEGLLRNQSPKIFREVEIVPGCAVHVACPSCPDHSPVSPGPGRLIRNMLGWPQLGEYRKVWGMVVPWCPPRGESFLFPCRSRRLGQEGVVPHSVVGPLWFFMHLFVCVRARNRYRATHWRAVLATACWCVEGHRTPDEAMVC